MTAALRQAFDGHVPTFMIKGMRLTSDNPACRVEVVARRVSRDIVPDGTSGAKTGGEIKRTNGEDVPNGTLGLPSGDPDREAALAALADIAEKREALSEDIRELAGKLADAKNGVGSGGLALTVRLKQLRERHRLTSAAPPALPLLPAIDAPSIRSRGIAASSDIDLDRCCFAHNCQWSVMDPAKIPLLVSHDEKRVAGALESIEVDSRGRVIVTGTITDHAAMTLPALSISAAVERFSIHNPDDRFGWHGSVDAVSEVSEISLSANPANRKCLLERWVPSAIDLSYEEMIDRVKRMQELVMELAA
jgi:hypothetical protein